MLGNVHRIIKEPHCANLTHSDLVALLDAFKTPQQPLERLFPGKGPFDTPPQRMDGGIAGFCRKFSFEVIWGMRSPHYSW